MYLERRPEDEIPNVIDAIHAPTLRFTADDLSHSVTYGNLRDPDFMKGVRNEGKIVTELKVQAYFMVERRNLIAYFARELQVLATMVVYTEASQISAPEMSAAAFFFSHKKEPTLDELMRIKATHERRYGFACMEIHRRAVQHMAKFACFYKNAGLLTSIPGPFTVESHPHVNFDTRTELNQFYHTLFHSFPTAENIHLIYQVGSSKKVNLDDETFLPLGLMSLYEFFCRIMVPQVFSDQRRQNDLLFRLIRDRMVPPSPGIEVEDTDEEN